MHVRFRKRMENRSYRRFSSNGIDGNLGK